MGKAVALTCVSLAVPIRDASTVFSRDSTAAWERMYCAPSQQQVLVFLDYSVVNDYIYLKLNDI